MTAQFSGMQYVLDPNIIQWNLDHAGQLAGFYSNICVQPQLLLENIFVYKEGTSIEYDTKTSMINWLYP